jgi:TRAP-type mannitol/chloroaromatic compound transport system permease large subunit
MEFIAQNFVPLMFGGLLLFLLTGFPVAFALAAYRAVLRLPRHGSGHVPASLFQALPLRVFGIMQNDTLLAIPFFTFMGIILERAAWPRICWKPSARCSARCAAAWRSR